MRDTLSAVSLLVRSLSDEIEARFERSFAQRDAELLRLRADVIALKDEAALTLATAKKYLSQVERPSEYFGTSISLGKFVEKKLKQFLDSKEFEEAVGQYFTDNWTGMQGVEDPDLVRLRADVIALKDEAVLTLANAKKYVENVDKKFENFLETIAFEKAVEQVINNTEFTVMIK